MKAVEAMSEHLAWPAAAIIILLLIIYFWERLARPFQRLPTIHRIKLQNFEIELSRENYDQVKTDTDKQFADLIKKQTRRF